MKTSDEYVESDGAKCPACKSKMLSVDGNVEVTGGGAYHGISCDECGSTWQDSYKLIGYEIFEEGEFVPKGKTNERNRI